MFPRQTFMFLLLENAFKEALVGIHVVDIESRADVFVVVFAVGILSGDTYLFEIVLLFHYVFDSYKFSRAKVQNF